MLHIVKCWERVFRNPTAHVRATQRFRARGPGMTQIQFHPRLGHYVSNADVNNSYVLATRLLQLYFVYFYRTVQVEYKAHLSERQNAKYILH